MRFKNWAIVWTSCPLSLPVSPPSPVLSLLKLRTNQSGIPHDIIDVVDSDVLEVLHGDRTLDSFLQPVDVVWAQRLRDANLEYRAECRRVDRSLAHPILISASIDTSQHVHVVHAHKWRAMQLSSAVQCQRVRKATRITPQGWVQKPNTIKLSFLFWGACKCTRSQHAFSGGAQMPAGRKHSCKTLTEMTALP